jgi:hypothetical protein
MRASEREEALQQPVRVVEIHAQLGVQLTGLLGDAAGLGDRDVEGGAHRRQRSAQLMRGVRDEPSLRDKRGLQPCQQPVDRVGRQTQLVPRATHRKAPESSYAGLVGLVEQSQAKRAPFVQMADRYAGCFLPATLVIARAAWAISEARSGGVGGRGSDAVPADPRGADRAGVRGLARGPIGGDREGDTGHREARRVADGVVRQDGTLTVGTPEVREVLSANGVPPNELLRLAASLDRYSAHVLGEALVRAADESNLRLSTPQAVAVSTAGAQVMIDLDKLLVGRSRPPLHHLDRVTGHSFSSGHTGQTAALCAVLVIEGFMLRGARPPQFAALVAGGLVVACVAFSRVYLGVHYPSDMVAGVVFGASWSALAIRLGHLWNSGDERSEIPVRAQGRHGRAERGADAVPRWAARRRAGHAICRRQPPPIGRLLRPRRRPPGHFDPRQLAEGPGRQAEPVGISVRRGPRAAISVRDFLGSG